MRLSTFGLTELGSLALATMLCATTTACDPGCPEGTTLEGGICKTNTMMDSAAESESAGDSATPATAGHLGVSATIAGAGSDAGSTAGNGADIAKPMNGTAAGSSGTAGHLSSNAGNANEPGTTSSAGSAAMTSGGAGGSGQPPQPTCGDGVISQNETCDPKSQALPCAMTCNDNDDCTTDAITGSAAECNIVCTHAAITSPINGDKCCPPTANSSNDKDCSPSCGNGVTDPGEACDGNCPSTCADDGDSCTKDVLTGTAPQCNVACTHPRITTPSSGDGCCPTGANNTTDKDCSPVCGNRVVESGEQCDGNCPSTCADDGNSCTKDTLLGSNGQCNVTCVHTRITTAINDDKCCPAGASSSTDNDCSRYTYPVPGTVYDTTTKLTWQQSETDTMQQPDAVSYCASSTFAGRSWQLPTRDQLHNLIDTSKQPDIDVTAFPGTYSGTHDGFWSSTTVDGKPDWGWDVYYSGGGGDSSDPFTTVFRARCVAR